MELKMKMDGLTEYQEMLNTQIQEELNRRGAAGVPWDDVPDALFDEATAAAEKIVGEDPSK
jgi:hypothetical protein